MVAAAQNKERIRCFRSSLIPMIRIELRSRLFERLFFWAMLLIGFAGIGSDGL
jgi:hypothetical protein